MKLKSHPLTLAKPSGRQVVFFCGYPPIFLVVGYPLLGMVAGLLMFSFCYANSTMRMYTRIKAVRRFFIFVFITSELTLIGYQLGWRESVLFYLPMLPASIVLAYYASNGIDEYNENLKNAVGLEEFVLARGTLDESNSWECQVCKSRNGKNIRQCNDCGCPINVSGKELMLKISAYRRAQKKGECG